MSDLVISAIIDGPLTGGTPKAIELLALKDIPDLSIYGIGSANNGGGSNGQEFTLSGSASAGDYLYIAAESTEATDFQSFFGFAPTYKSGAASINGDDAIELFMNGAVVDVFGDINVDGTGQPWEYEDGWAYRKANTGPDGSTFQLSNWLFSGVDALDGATTNATATTPVPVGNFEQNSAPVLTGNATFTAIAEDVPNPSNLGNTVSELLNNLVTDADFDPRGIAVTGIDNTNGTWQYSTDGGTTWQNLDPTVSATNATTLGATSLYTGYAGNAPGEQPWLAFANIIGAVQTQAPVGVTLNTTPNNLQADNAIYSGYSNFVLTPPATYTLVNSNFPTLNSTVGYTLSFNLQVLFDSQVGGNPNRAGFSILAISQDPSKSVELAFQDDQIFAQTLNGANQFVAGETRAFNTTQEVQYSLAVQGTAYKLFADGNEILTGPLRDYTPGDTGAVPDPYGEANFIYLGDNTSSARGRFQLEQVALETSTRLRFVPNADYNGNATLQFRAWDTTDGSSNGQTGVNASQGGGFNAFSATLGTGTITVNPETTGGTPGMPGTPPVTPGIPTVTPTTPSPMNPVFNFEQWVSLKAIRTGEIFQSKLVDFNVEIGGLRIAPLFDETQYLNKNPDVAAAVQQGAFKYGFEHFVLFGIDEGRSPGDWFDQDYYLAQNPDVAGAVKKGTIRSAIAHFFAFGHREKRNPSRFFDADDYLLNNPDVKLAVEAGKFDSPFEHYSEFGGEEGRLSGLLFEESYYLNQNPDVAAAVKTGTFALGLYHFLSFGQSEGRDPSALFDQSAYLERYGDVAAAVAGGAFASAFEHYVWFGRAEGRITV